MHIPAKVDYGIRATLCLATSSPKTADALAAEQEIPRRFLGSILGDLRRGGIVVSRRGTEGGFRLARSPHAISLADIIRVLDGPLAEVRGLRPEAARYDGPALHLQKVWVAVRANLRQVLESVSLADVVSGELPDDVLELTNDPDSWLSR
ncbi:MAG: RrF2 family transcriptional regulator [Acidimicrobiales bacterium]